MWIVRLALRRPYTFVVMSVLIVILGIAAAFVMPTDIFPNIDIPVVSVIWTYTGISPEEMEKRITTISERALTTTVNDIEHIESQSYNGVTVIEGSSSPARRSNWPSRRSPLSRRPSFASCRPASFHRPSSSTTPPACPSCS